MVALIRSIEAEEFNQQILEAKRNFDAGHDGLRAGMITARRCSIFKPIDTYMLPEQYQAHLRDIMSTREMQPHTLASFTAPTKLEASKITEVKPPLNPAAGPTNENLIDDVLAKEMVLVQAMRQRGQDRSGRP